MNISIQNSICHSIIRFSYSLCSTDDSCQYWLKETTLTSPYYPKYFLSDGIGCEWILTAPERHIIALEFNAFDVSFLKVLSYKEGITKVFILSI